MLDSIVKVIRGIVRLRGATDNTLIGNAGDKLKVDGSGVTQPVSAATLPLPTGAATAANQTSQITALQLIDDLPHTQNAVLNKGAALMGQLDDTATVAATEDRVAVARITAQRALHSNLRTSAGAEIGAVGDRLKVDALMAGGIQTFSRKLRIDKFNIETVYPLPIYQTVYNYSGSGLLIGFNIEADSDKLQVRLTLDSEVIYTDLDSKFLKDIGFINTSLQSRDWFGTNNNSSHDFSPSYPIPFSSSVNIAVRKSDLGSMKIVRYLVILTKET